MGPPRQRDGGPTITEVPPAADVLTAWWLLDAAADGPQIDDAAVLAPLARRFGQVRSRERVRDLAEVFTHQREVDAMLDLMPKAFEELDTKFLEPSAGSGNFTTAILRRKLRLVAKNRCASQEEYEHALLRAVASIYGVDICADNVTEARARMGHAVLEHYQTDANTVVPTTAFMQAVAAIIDNNIVVGDTINSADTIEMCDWRPHPGGRFQRVWSYALNPHAHRDLFWAERIQDTEPVHYSELAVPDRGRRSATRKAASR